jgi:DNA-binding CsgD family transcriptional regulator
MLRPSSARSRLASSVAPATHDGIPLDLSLSRDIPGRLRIARASGVIAASTHHDIGTCLLDASNEIVAANDEAIQLLMYPESAGECCDARCSQIIRALAISSQRSEDGSWRAELRSGRRHYLCHAIRMTGPTPGGLTTHTVVLIERPLTNGAALSRLSFDFGLTKREAEAVGLLSGGLTNKEIARCMHVSAHTVKTVLHHIMIKMKMSTRAGIVGALIARTV